MPVLLIFPELRSRGVTLGRRQVDRLEAAGRFPKRVQISQQRVAWVATEIDEYVAERRRLAIEKGRHNGASSDYWRGSVGLR